MFHRGRNSPGLRIGAAPLAVTLIVVLGLGPQSLRGSDLEAERGIQLTGSIVRPDGKRVPSLVTVRNLSRGITWTFLSSESGAFVLGGVPAGDYRVWIRSQNLAEADFALPDLQADHHLEVEMKIGETPVALPNADMLAYLPDEGQARQLLRFHCIQCHGLEFIVGAQKSAAEWQSTVQSMAARVPPTPDGQMEQIARYLARHFGPENRTEVPTLGARRYAFEPGAVMVEIDLPEAAAHPHEMVLGPDGKLWVSDFDVRPNLLHNSLFRIDPDTLQVETLKIPISATGARSIAFDGDGNPWVAILFGDVLARLNPETGNAEAFQVPGKNIWPHTIVFDGQGQAWFTGMRSDSIGSLDPAKGVFQEFTVPTARSMLFDLEADDQGNLWYTGLFAHKLGKFNPRTHRFTEFPTPTPLSSTRYLTIGPRGDIWIALFAAGKIARFDRQTETFQEIALADPNSSPYDLLVTEKGFVWFTNFTRNSLGRLDPATGTVEEFSILSSPYARPTEIELGPSGKIWFCENGMARVAYLDPTGLAEPGVYSFSADPYPGN